MLSSTPLFLSLFFFINLPIEQVDARVECRQRLYEARGSPQSGSNGFSLHVEDPAKNFTDVEGYTPGHLYRVSIKGKESSPLTHELIRLGRLMLFWQKSTVLKKIIKLAPLIYTCFL
jgi:hypothetical protein